MKLAIYFAASTNALALVLGGSAAAGNVQGHMDFRSFGGLKNTEASGVDGDVALTTLHHTSNDAYTIVLELNKSY